MPLRSALTQAAFRHRGSAPAGAFIRQMFAHASRALPVERVEESRHVLAFHHPVPGFRPVHVLLVPKFSARTLLHLTTAQREQVTAEIELLVPQILVGLGRSETGFLVFVNGGARQDVRQVHFHLVTSGYDLAAAPPDVMVDIWTDINDSSCAVHQVRVGTQPLAIGLTRAVDECSMLGLEALGYSVVWDARDRNHDLVHLTAGPASAARDRRS